MEKLYSLVFSSFDLLSKYAPASHPRQSTIRSARLEKTRPLETVASDLVFISIAQTRGIASRPKVNATPKIPVDTENRIQRMLN